MPAVEIASNAESVTDITSTPGASELLSETVAALEDDAESVTMYEGSMSGALYTKTNTGFMEMALEAGEPTVSSVAEPREDVTELVKIEPEEEETVTDAVNNVRYTGGD